MSDANAMLAAAKVLGAALENARAEAAALGFERTRLAIDATLALLRYEIGLLERTTPDGNAR